MQEFMPPQGGDATSNVDPAAAPGTQPGTPAPEEGQLEMPEEVAAEPSGLPELDTSGTSVNGDPYSMVAPGGPDPDEEIPEDVINAYYEDLVSRVMLWASDNEVPKGRASSPADTIIDRLNLRGAAAPEAIGGTAAEMILTITQNAKRQGVEYPTQSILNAGIDAVETLIDLSREAGIFPDIPEDHDDPGFEQVLLTASLEATKAYGERLLATGQIDQAEYKEILNEKMEEEAALGELDDWDPSQMVSGEGMQHLAKLSRQQGMRMGQQKPGALPPSPQGGEVPPQQGQPPQGGPVNG